MGGRGDRPRCARSSLLDHVVDLLEPGSLEHHLCLLTVIEQHDGISKPSHHRTPWGIWSDHQHLPTWPRHPTELA